MDHSALVKITYACDKLLHDLNNVRFSYLVVLQKLEQFSAVNLLHHNEHPTFRFVNFSHFNDIWMAQQTNNLDLISQKLFLALVEFSFVDLFQGVRYLCSFVFCFENFRKLTTAKASSLGVEIIHAIKLTVVLQLSYPVVNHGFIFVE